MHVNGDDAVGLFKGDTLLDTVGQPESDIGKGWDACGVTAATYKHTLIKKEGKIVFRLGTPAGTNADDCHWIVKKVILKMVDKKLRLLPLQLAIL